MAIGNVSLMFNKLSITSVGNNFVYMAWRINLCREIFKL